MQTDVLTQIILPLSLFVIMLGMGLALKIADFYRVTMEPKGGVVSIQNGTVALLVSGTLLGNALMTIPAVTYSLLMFVTGGVFGYLVNRQRGSL